MTHGLFTVFRAEPGAGDSLADLLVHAARAMSANPECSSYQVGRTTVEDEVCVFELWSDEAARLASLQTDAVRDLITRAGPLVATVASQTSYRVLETTAGG
jgi:quinol monooxygenase YgiN